MAAVSAHSEDSSQEIAAWFEAYHQPIFRYLVRLTADEQLAADLLQETFLRAWSALARQPPPENPEAWLYRIATNLAYTALRRQSRWRWLRLADQESPSRFEQQLLTAQVVRRCLLRLRPGDVEALLLYEWVGLSCAEIGRLNGDTATAVRMRLSRARARFAQLYDEEAEL